MEIIGQIGASIMSGDEIASPDTCMKLTQVLCLIENKLDDETMRNLYGTISQEAHEGVSMLFTDFISA